MDDDVNPWFRPHDSEAAFWADPATHALPWPLWKTRFTWTPDRDLIPVPGRTLYRSFTTLHAGQFHPPAGFELVEPWTQEPVRLVWMHVPEQIVLTYTEGDLSFLVCSTIEAWWEALRDLIAFYRDR